MYPATFGSRYKCKTFVFEIETANFTHMLDLFVEFEVHLHHIVVVGAAFSIILHIINRKLILPNYRHVSVLSGVPACEDFFDIFVIS